MLLDTNIVIYACKPEGQELAPLTSHPNAAVASVIWIESLGYKSIQPEEALAIRGVLSAIMTYPLDEEIIHRAIQLRQQKSMKLGDAIIAATALEYGVPLVTRNEGDFKHISGLQIINPFADQTKQNSRYLLFLDILGFKEMVAKRSASEVFGVINDALKSFLIWEDLNGEFKTIYFSDSFLFFQEHKGYGAWDFLDIYAMAGMLLSALLAKGIPARGAISFGEFEVQIDSSNRHQIYLGKAFIEAYAAEQKENWVGITILPSAWQVWNDEKESMKAFESDGVWMCRHDEVLLLMPFIKLRSCYWSSIAGEVEDSFLEAGSFALANDIRAFDFLRKTARRFRSKGDFSSKEATKYHATMSFLADVMKDDFYTWANMICDKELGGLNNTLSASPSGEK